MARVTFNISISGTGRTLEKAYRDAVYDFLNNLDYYSDDVSGVNCDDCHVLADSIDDLVDGQLCQKCHLKEENDEDEVEKG